MLLKMLYISNLNFIFQEAIFKTVTVIPSLGLERHITTMYEELVEEFDFKKSQANQSEYKDQKIALLSSEVAKVAVDAKKNETVSNHVLYGGSGVFFIYFGVFF